jgi:hypothetical protein
MQSVHNITLQQLRIEYRPHQSLPIENVLLDLNIIYVPK